MSEAQSLTDELAVVFAQMTSVLMAHETLQTAIQLVTDLATEAVPDAGASGITLVRPDGAKTTAAATDPVTERADALQYQLDQGPCLSAWQTRSLVRMPSLAEEHRWPRWTNAVRELDLQSCLSAPLIAGDDALGAIKLYAARPHAFDAHAERLLVKFAAQAAVLVANMQAYDNAQQLAEQLKDALRTRDLIGQAKGMLMAMEGVDEHTAFDWLVSASSRQNRKLREVASQLVGRYTTRGS